MATVVFVENRAGMRHAFETWTGMTGRYIFRKTGEVRLAAIAEAPGPGKPPHNRSGLNWGKGLLQTKITTSYGHRPTGELESTVTSNADYSLMVHRGTRRHPITPRTGAVLRFRGRDGGIHFRAKVDHPGTEANPFLLRALEHVF
jgi:hypothetical protein